MSDLMSAPIDPAELKVRERVWITKIDHSEDPPKVVEELAFEDGRLLSVTRPEEG